MCTAVAYKTRDSYFGRNLDLEFSYGETVTVTPRGFRFSFGDAGEMREHYAMIGMAHMREKYPLYYDACNEKGLGMAGLNFPHSAVYQKPRAGKHNIASFALIPWVLGQCGDLAEAERLLRRTSVTGQAFSEELPPTPLHWMVTDGVRSLAVEPMADGLHIHENPVGVLTNEPPFEMQLTHLRSFLHLSAQEPENRFSSTLQLTPYSRGMGAIGLPGDLSSSSRFVRAAFTAGNSVCGEGELESVGQGFHILNAVAQTQGCVRLDTGCEKTVYSCCINLCKGIYYYSTYGNEEIIGVDLRQEELAGNTLISYPLLEKTAFRMQNGHQPLP